MSNNSSLKMGVPGSFSVAAKLQNLFVAKLTATARKLVRASGSCEATGRPHHIVVILEQYLTGGFVFAGREPKHLARDPAGRGSKHSSS